MAPAWGHFGLRSGAILLASRFAVQYTSLNNIENIERTSPGETMSVDHSTPSSPTPVVLRQDFVGGLVIIAVAAFAFWQGADLPIGTFGGMGPGMLPRGWRSCSACSVRCSRGGRRLGEWARRLERVVDPRAAVRARRGGGVRRSPCARSGLLVAGPLAIVIGAFASDEVRWIETHGVRRGR